MENGKFIISLDFELHWGGVEIWEVEKKKKYFSDTVQIIPKLLKLFEEHSIKASWATVGFLFAKNKAQLVQFSPEQLPTYVRQDLSYYKIIEGIGENETEDSFHYAPSLIKLILKTSGQELASHTFAHYYCNELGQTLEQFDADLKAAQAIARENFNITLKSLVFPRNQFNENYVDIARQNGFKVVRSNPNVWFWNSNYGKLTSLFRALDTLIPISRTLSFKKVILNEGVLQLPASRFFRPYSSSEGLIQKLKLKRIKNEMTYAAKNKLNYHLWWHPHNFGNDPEKNLGQLLEIVKHFKSLEEKYNFTSANMIDFSLKIDDEK